MAKMRNALMMVVIIELALFAFAKTDYGLSSLANMLLHIELYSFGDFLGYLIPALTVTGGAILIGTLTGQVDWMWRAGISVVLFTFLVSIINLGIFIYSQDYWKGDAVAGFITAIALLPLMLYYIMTTIDFISGKD